MKKIILIALITLIVLLSLLKYFGIFGTEKYYRADQSAVVKEIVSLNRLETASFNIEKIIEAGKAGNSLQNILFGDKILLIAHGQVIAGFDLSKLSKNNVEVSGEILKLQLPAPEILVTKLDSGKTRVYDRKLGWLTKGDTNLESDARLTAEQKIRQAACESGILDVAAENLRKQIVPMLQNLGYQEIDIEVSVGECK